MTRSMSADEAQRIGREVLRHAMVLPSVAAKMIRKSLQVEIAHGKFKSVSAGALVNWPDEELPSQEVATAIRHAFMLRVLPMVTHLLRRKPGLEITVDNTTALSESDRKYVAQLLDCPRLAGRTRDLTVSDFKDAWPLQIQDTLGLLARIEAMLWVTSQQPQPVTATTATTATTAQATGLPHQAQSPALDAADTELELTASLNWRAELENITRCALNDHHDVPVTSHIKERWLRIFISRFSGENGRTMQEVSNRFCMTRERVRQITEKTLITLKSQPLALPAFDRLMAAAEHILPMAPEQANIQLAQFLGPNMGLQAALSFAQDMGIKNPLIDTSSTKTKAKAQRQVKNLYKPQLQSRANAVASAVPSIVFSVISPVVSPVISPVVSPVYAANF